jgi:RNA recognition motif-containing protein
MAKVYVKNIPYEANESQVIKALADYGAISCELKRHARKKNFNAGSGYVEFACEKDAKDCIAKTPFDLLRPKCMGRPLHILPIKSKNKKKAASDDIEIESNFTLSTLEIGNWSSAALQEDGNPASSFNILNGMDIPSRV